LTLSNIQLKETAAGFLSPLYSSNSLPVSLDREKLIFSANFFNSVSLLLGVILAKIISPTLKSQLFSSFKQLREDCKFSFSILFSASNRK